MRAQHRLWFAVALLAFASLPLEDAAADAIADFYRGKELRLIISASVGGGYDVYARVMAKHLGEHLPDNPTIVPQNMPAGGGLAAANYLYNIAARDGTVIATLQNTVPFEPFFDNRQAQFDARKTAVARDFHGIYQLGQGPPPSLPR
jgi:tripartite-type tricarboxylate transporter receptor subunit TctC